MAKNSDDSPDDTFFDRFKSTKIKIWPVEKVKYQNGLCTMTLVFQEVSSNNSKSWASKKSFRLKSKEGSG